MNTVKPVPGRPIKVLVVDDHKVVRKGLKAFLMSYDDLVLVGEAGSGEEALRQCQRKEPDVILMDLVMPGMGGAAAARQIRETLPDIRVIILTSFTDEELVDEAIQSGAISYLLKNVDADELAEAIRNAVRGQPTLAPEATKALVQSAARPSRAGHDLTPREREVLALLAEGLTNQEIGQILQIKHSTVRFHVSNLLDKLNAGTRTEAVVLALQHGLVG